ncbi:chaperonin 10-like protein [Fennellomyces sp. T-0311]|nr:chaperonin 10-like protein [Fennellomyces sp. T-0311]
MSTSTEDTFHGWACPGKHKPLEWTELPLKRFQDDDVELAVTHCGICGSDLHTMDSGWGPTDYPCVVGHEIVGIVTRVGKNVTNLKVGDRAGVGAQSGSCLECPDCKNEEENLCRGCKSGTYNSRWPTGEKTYGGYADKWRGHQHFVFKVPDNMTNEVAATFFCAGVTTYAPLKKYGVTKGSRVGVIGVGGLGHFAVQWAKAMGAEVLVISSSDRKREDAKLLGADDYVVGTDFDEMAKRDGRLTHIICTSFANDFDWTKHLSLLDRKGIFIMVALPESPLSGIPAGVLISRQITFAGSNIGSPKEIREMLEFAAETGVKPWIQKYPMTQAADAVQALRDGKAKYRFVLEN